LKKKVAILQVTHIIRYHYYCHYYYHYYNLINSQWNSIHYCN
jgi:hypothetical protein